MYLAIISDSTKYANVGVNFPLPLLCVFFMWLWSWWFTEVKKAEFSTLKWF